MKKLFAILMALMMAAAAVSFAMAEGETDEDVDWEEASVPAELRAMFEGAWVCGPAMIRVFVEDGGFRIAVTVPDEAGDDYAWEYACLYSEELGCLTTLTDTGIKFAVTLEPFAVYDINETVYEDGAATFALNEAGQLTWNDAKENAGEGMAFDRIGDFIGVWVADRPEIEIDWNAENACYDVRIHWADSAMEVYDWSLTGTYNAENGTLEAAGTVTFTVWNDNAEIVSEETSEATAVFSFGEGGLLWDGARDIVFEWLGDNL